MINIQLKLKMGKKSDARGCDVFHSSTVTVHPSEGSLELEIDLSLSKNYSLTKEAPSKWIIKFPGNICYYYLNVKWFCWVLY